MIFIGLTYCGYAQEEAKIISDGYQVFYYPNGNKSSEGTMRNGKPDGYWKTYNEAGKLVSEGNRKDFELDSAWKFFDENGKIALEIKYLKGKKEGIRKTYREDEIIEEMFKNDREDFEKKWETGKEITIAASKVPAFKAGKALKIAVK